MYSQAQIEVFKDLIKVYKISIFILQAVQSNPVSYFIVCFGETCNWNFNIFISDQRCSLVGSVGRKSVFYSIMSGEVAR